MSIRILNAVIHGFEKEQHTTGVAEENVVIKNRVLDVSLLPVEKLISSVAKLLGGRTNTQSWGRFDSERGGSFYSFFSAEYENLKDASIFLMLTKKAMVEIIRFAADSTSSTGSKVLFALYRDDSHQERLLVALIKQKGGITLDQDYVPVDVQEIDMSKLSQAADIRCSEYGYSLAEEELMGDPVAAGEEVESDDDSGREARNYLSFLSSRDASDAAGYFIKALGCTINETPRQSTKSVIDLTIAFFEKSDVLRPYAKLARDAVCDYLKVQLKGKASAKLDALVHAAGTVVPGQHVEQVQGLLDYFNSDKNRVPAEFFVHSGELKKKMRVVVDTEDMQLRFNKSAIGTDSGARVFYNREQRVLIINHLSDKQMEQLDKQVQ